MIVIMRIGPNSMSEFVCFDDVNIQCYAIFYLFVQIDMQFGFMKGKGTTDAIFMARQMQEDFRVKGKKLYFGFVDLEKAFDRVPREVISWAMPKLGVEEWLVSAVMSMYIGAKTVVRTVYGNNKGFEVKVGMHQGSGLSPLLFVIVMEAISSEFRVALPWQLLHADDLAVIAETEEELLGD